MNNDTFGQDEENDDIFSEFQNAPNPAAILLNANFSTATKGVPTDPDTMPAGQSQWHLVGTWGLHADQVWMDYTGLGVIVGVMDDGFQYTHSEISANYRTDLDRDAFSNDADAAPVYSTENHGTSVIGTILADDNGAGGVGVAFDAQGYGIRIDLHGNGGTLEQIITGYEYALSTGLDVMNNSWGSPGAFTDTLKIDFAGRDYIDLRGAMHNLVDSGRDGLGSNIVFAAGNDRAGGDNVNYHNILNSPYTIAVGALNTDGTYASFSTPGAALLVSAGGVSVYTTDRTGTAGYSSGDYTNFSGTSAAAPVVSGAIAVMLEANPDLGWRDVQEILAYSAQHNNPASLGWQYNGAGNWNGGGLHFSHDYGYGATDLFTAVRLAETWDLQQTSANMVTTTVVTSTPNLAIPLTGTVSNTINIAQDIEIEHAIINLNITHAHAGDLVVTLISPDGTQSVLINRLENGNFTQSAYGVTGVHFETMSTAHWGESSVGTWTLQITDAAGGNAGTLSDWSLSFMGNAQSANDTYIYTNDYGNFSGAELTSRATLTDASGTDAINLAAVTSNTTLNMNAGTASTVAGKTLNIAAGTVIENAYLGDGNDTVTGNGTDNVIYGGRGSDTLDGGAGSDTAGYFDAITNYVFNFISSVTVEIATAVGTLWTDIVTNFEKFLFGNDLYTRSQLEDYVGAPSTTTGTNAADVLNGGTGADTISGGGGNDLIHGNGGSDTLNGDAGNDTLYGDSGDDTLNGGTGSDTMIGGTGDDYYIVDSTGDIVTELADEGTETVTSSISYALTAHVENLILSGTIALSGTGNNLNNIITGNVGNNILNGGAGNDTLIGGLGNDTYIVDSTSDIIVESLGEGTDFVQSSATYALSANVENLTLTGTANINGTGNDLNNIITGNSGNNILSGGNGGLDRLIGGLGDDTYIITDTIDTLVEGVNAGTDTVQSNIAYVLATNFENLILTGTANINGTGNTVANVLTGNSGNNILNGGTGADTMIGGLGNDTYIVDNIGDTATESAGAGTDIVMSGVSFTLSANIENLTLTGAAAINGTGNTLDNIITGNAAANTLTGGDGNDTLNGGSGNDILYGGNGNDTLIGGAGNDTMAGGAGNDSYIVDTLLDIVTELAGEGTDTVTTAISYTLSANVENLILSGASMINGTGNALNNIITGNAGSNILDGGAGNDTLIGGLGNDTYIVDSALDIIIENAASGTDLVKSTAASYTMSANLENMILLGTDNINGTGNDLDNIVTGNAGNNILNGGSGGLDRLIGGLGDDTYIITDTVDILVEGANAGTDTVQSNITYVLAANFENLTLTGSGNINGTGNTVANVLIGNSGNNILNGGTGADTMIGGGGNDTYIVDNIGDTVTEGAGAGTDTVMSGISYALGSHVENLTLTGTAAITATGNELNNTLTGNTGANILDGGLGADTMIGGTGNDTYIIDNAGDTVIENLNGGTDAILSNRTLTLFDNVENLTLTGTGNFNATGNALNNILTGNSGNNILDGVSGSDKMIGGDGDDTYYINSTGDSAIEALSQGTDLVYSSITHTLGANIENLTLTGSDAIHGTGNALDNVIYGNTANNTLNGSSGNDTLHGGDGNDTLIGGIGDDILFGDNGADILSGGTGSDTFVFKADTAFNGIDQITDFKLAENDALDISDVLSGHYDPLNDTLSDFVQIANSGSSSILSIDLDGTGATYGFTQIATLTGVINLTNEDLLVTNGNLIV